MVAQRVRGELEGTLTARRVVLLLLAAALPLLSGTAAAQSREDLVRRFKAYLSSAAYSNFIAEKVLAYDAAMPPRCGNRELTGERRLFSVTKMPAFVETRQVPTAGEWAERVQVRRCGRTVWHNLYLRASKRRGLHAVNGFPGRSLTALTLQLRAGRAFLETARRADPGCKRFDVVAMRVTERPSSRTAPWSEAWTAWVCGKTVTRPIRFTPQGGEVTFQVR